MLKRSAIVKLRSRSGSPITFKMGIGIEIAISIFDKDRDALILCNPATVLFIIGNISVIFPHANYISKSMKIIHQPEATIYQQFDQIILRFLKAEVNPWKIMQDLWWNQKVIKIPFFSFICHFGTINLSFLSTESLVCVMLWVTANRLALIQSTSNKRIQALGINTRVP